MDVQGGAYATGVLVLITSAAAAVTIASWNGWLRWPFLFVSLVFLYTTAMNIVERPEGIKIAAFFIGAMVVTSVISPALRSTELRICGVEFDEQAIALLSHDEDQVIRLIAHRPSLDTEAAFDEIEHTVRHRYGLDPEERIYLLALLRGDASEFEDTLRVTGRQLGRHAVLEAQSPVVPNAIAALLIELEKTTRRMPHAYFKWTEGNPIVINCAFSYWVRATSRPLPMRYSAVPSRNQSTGP